MRSLLLAILVASVSSAHAQKHEITCIQQGVACVEYTLNERDYQKFKAQCQTSPGVDFREGHECPRGPSCYHTAGERVAETYFSSDISVKRQRAICEQHNGEYRE